MQVVDDLVEREAVRGRQRQHDDEDKRQACQQQKDEILPGMIKAGQPCSVIDDSGAAVGTLALQSVIDTLIGKDARS